MQYENHRPGCGLYSSYSPACCPLAETKPGVVTPIFNPSAFCEFQASHHYIARLPSQNRIPSKNCYARREWGEMIFRPSFSAFTTGIESQHHPHVCRLTQTPGHNRGADSALALATPSTEVTSGQVTRPQLFLFRFRVQPTAHSVLRTLVSPRAHPERGRTMTPKARLPLPGWQLGFRRRAPSAPSPQVWRPEGSACSR